ncbi:MAG: AIPR family protein [Rickettsiales bacterium]|nr:AIPR family protein [Pseudomonadota bacterium]MDA0966559.1 AIPR family protein [Pseudomonadota bacterium]MDG4543588.1 AIPR family protein [Rickettsiales bacterium]MDG4545735.1 AIPR family protein [Rickettsiales bacterium]MDG4547492.1 AIPR family protein [Rickettsiales bacterium]
MSIYKILDKSIEKNADSVSELLSKFNGDILRGSKFMLFALSKIFYDKDIADIEAGIVDSSYREATYDHGIDAIYITASKSFVENPEDLEECNDDTKFEIQIFQFKRGTGISHGDILKLKAGIKKVLIDCEMSDRDNLYFYNRIGVLNEIKEQIFSNFPTDNISVVCNIVFGGMENTLLNDTIVSGELDNIKNELESGGYVQSQIKVMDCQFLIRDPSKNQNIVDSIEYEKTFKYITDTEQSKKLNGYISIIKGSEIAELVRKHQSSIFEANIRDYFKRSDLNSKIIETSSNDSEAKYFWSFNNGLTMTCSKVEELPSNKYKLHNLQIVNGCQTSNSIYNAVKNKEKVQELKLKESSGVILTVKEQEELKKKDKQQFNDDTTLLVKIIETKDDDLIYRITETTNSQTPIKAFSLRANDNIQKLIETFLSDYDISYERRVNELRNKGKKNIYSIQKLFQLFTSHILFKPSQARTSPKTLFISTYDEVFPEPNVININYILYFIPIYVDIHLNKAIKEFNTDAIDPYKKTILAYGKFHMGCFLLSSILKNDYNKKGIIENEQKIKSELSNNLERHFMEALENFEKIIKTFGGNKKETIASSVRKADLDNRIVKFVKSQK